MVHALCSGRPVRTIADSRSRGRSAPCGSPPRDLRWCVGGHRQRAAACRPDQRSQCADAAQAYQAAPMAGPPAAHFRPAVALEIPTRERTSRWPRAAGLSLTSGAGRIVARNTNRRAPVHMPQGRWRHRVRERGSTLPPKRQGWDGLSPNEACILLSDRARNRSRTILACARASDAASQRATSDGRFMAGSIDAGRPRAGPGFLPLGLSSRPGLCRSGTGRRGPSWPRSGNPAPRNSPTRDNRAYRA